MPKARLEGRGQEVTSSAPIIQGERAWAGAGENKEAAGDGDVLHEADHLHLVVWMKVEQ